MWYAILILIILTCATGWTAYYISTLSLLLYMQKKGYTLPAKEEQKACIREVVSNLISGR